MRTLFFLLRAARPAFRGKFAARILLVVSVASLAGATAGLLPAVVGVALNAVLGEPRPSAPGIAEAMSRALAGAPSIVVLAVAFVATLATVAATVMASKLGSQLAAEATASLRIAMLRSTLSASARDVDDAGQSIASSKPGPKAPPGFKAPAARGSEVVKLAIARESGLSAEFAIAVITGLPQAIVTLSVLAYELVAAGTWIVLGGGALLFLLSRLASDRASRRVARETHSLQQADVGVFAEIGDKLAMTEDLRLLGAREQAVSELAEASYRAADARTRVASALAVSGQIKSVFTALSPLLILVALQVSSRAVDPGEVAKLLLYVPLLLSRLEGLDALRVGLIERAPVLDAVARLLQLKSSPSRHAEPIPLADDLEGSITFDRVSFTPPGSPRAVLDELSLRIPKGAVVGICGPSGCGKSTLLRLLLRLDEPDSGTIALGDAELSRIEPDDLPRVFAVLGQGSRLLERAIGENLALGMDPAPSPEAMRAALRAASLDELGSASGERGLDTPFRAVPPSLSGGEQRRVLIARMLVRDARVLVLDEPEAGLPSATAEAVLKTISEIAAGRTCVVVTHAPHLLGSTFNVVMDAGKVAAQGTHEELVATSELYRSLLAEGLRQGERGVPKAAEKPRA